MHFQLHRYVRRVFISEIQEFLNLHPFYGIKNKNDSKFMSSPTIVTERYNFDGRHYPAIVITTSSANEINISINKFIDERRGHVRPSHMLSFFTAKIDDDPQYRGQYTDATYILEVVNMGKEKEEDLKLQVNKIAPNKETKIFDLKEDLRATDIIPGARIIFGSFNDLRVGEKIQVDVFEQERYLGDIYGSKFSMDIKADIYAQTLNETEELMDLLLAQATYLLPQRLFYVHHLSLTSTSTEGIEKEGEIGEEFFKGSITYKVNSELNMFIPSDLVEEYRLDLMFTKNLTYPSDSDKLIISIG